MVVSVCKAVTDGLSDYSKKRMRGEKICISAISDCQGLAYADSSINRPSTPKL